MSNATDKQWRVQVRHSKAHKWVNKGLFETRETARQECASYRGDYWGGCYGDEKGRLQPVFGFGNTRVVRYVKALK